MLNHWADLFPPRRAANATFQTARRCSGGRTTARAERGLPVNLIAVDHYDVGDLIPAVAS